MIYVNITGGLGNQLFQYAFAKRIQKETGQEITLNIYELSTYDFKRRYELDKFALTKYVCVSDDKLPWYVHRRNYISKVLRKIFPRFFWKMCLLNNSYVWYEETEMTIPAPKLNKDIYIGGYWQNYKYSIDALDELKKDYVLITQLEEKNKKLLESIKNSNSVCIHIRRGDYVGTDYEVCTKHYYEKAISSLMTKIQNPKFYVFSDDIEWAKVNISCKNRDVVFVEEHNSAEKDLWLMRNCRHFIISNSTFSWWAQYLGDFANKVVYAPSQWHKKIDGRDLYLENWNIINVIE
ncbi:alpha-1,2-fucosyltransferase [Enterococcus faecium]|nr:alpha-1,2-fucosyltransferase [Enterococcus faecium]